MTEPTVSEHRRNEDRSERGGELSGTVRVPAPRRLAPGDLLRVGAIGLRTRPQRALLSALGIAIGIAAMLSVVGISASGRADLQRTLDALGTNLLTVAGADDSTGQKGTLPDEATAMVRRIGPVTQAASVSELGDVHVYRTDLLPAEQTEGIVVFAADAQLATVVGARMADGAWFTGATSAYPTVVLGADSARRLGLSRAGPGILVRVGGRQFAVIGILAPVALVPELDSAALVSPSAAQTSLGAQTHPTTVFLRTTDDQVDPVRAVLAQTANPAEPYLTVVSRPSDVLAAKIATERALNQLLLGLGAVALVVGGVGVANTMLISVLERRAEIGLRRSLGATRGQIRAQFVTEALILTGLGGAGGVVLSAAVVAGYSWTQYWPVVLPWWVVGAGLAATFGLGAIAGIYPAVRAARLPPTEALAT